MMRILNYLFLLVLASWSLAPFLWQWATSFKDPASASRIPPVLPAPLNWENYLSVLGNDLFLKVIFNSLMVSFGATAISLSVGVLGAYGISRFLKRGKNWLLIGLLIIFMMPQVALVAPLFKFMVQFHIKDTIFGLIMVYSVFSVPLVVWIMHQVFEEIPESLYRAAQVDRSGHWKIFFRIYLPLGGSGLISAGLLSIIFCWNEFLFALTFTSTYASRTIPVGITLFSGQFEFPWGEISAATSIVTFPLLLVVVFAQKYLVRGLVGNTEGG